MEGGAEVWGRLREVRGRPPHSGGAAEEAQGAVRRLREQYAEVVEEDGGVELVVYRAPPSEALTIAFAEGIEGGPKLVIVFFT